VTEDQPTFRDPHKGQTVVLKSLPTDHLDVIEHQRKTRPSHVANLVESIERIGFIVPLVAIETKRGSGTSEHLVIDGQHRLQAASEVGLRKVPVLVVPARLAPRMMNLNVEKDLNIREKAAVALGIYRSFLESHPSLKENDAEVVESIERAYFVTLGLAYERDGRLAGGAFEPLLKKCDHFMRRVLENAHPIREERAKRVRETNGLIKAVVAEAKEIGAFHQYFQYQLISYIDPFKRKRGRQNFDELFDKATATLEKLKADPARIRRLGGG
jgi:ParB family chromosome partitioning protein